MGNAMHDVSLEALLKKTREDALREAISVAEACERQNWARVTDSEHQSHYRAGLRSAGQAIASGIRAIMDAKP